MKSGKTQTKAAALATTVYLLLVGTATPSYAVPEMMGYSGYLTDAERNPVDGSLAMVFRIFDAETGGNRLFEEIKDAVTVSNGYFYVLLSANTISGGMGLDELFSAHTTLYLEVQVDSDVMTPRQQLSPVPWALGFDYIDTDTLAGLTCYAGDLVKWNGTEWICDIDEDSRLSESQVEAYISDDAIDLAAGTTIGGLEISTGAHTTYLPWTSITDKPVGLNDGDDDSLGDLATLCTNGQLPRFNGTAWACDDDDDTVGSLSCINGDVAQWNGASWVCDPDDDTQLSEAQVETYITNGAINLFSGSSVNGYAISTTTHIHDWSEIGNRPTGLDDGDDELTESEVETFITNGLIDLASGSRVGGYAISTTTHIHGWSEIGNRPTGLDDGDDELTESEVETFITNGAIALNSGTTIHGRVIPNEDNIIVVAKDGGHFTSVAAAVGSITATPGNPYLVRVAPGIYDEQVHMAPFVDLEGSGEGKTVIQFSGGGIFDGSSATVSGASYSEVRNLTIRSDCSTGNPFCIGMYNDGVTHSSRLTHVTIENTTGSGGAGNLYGVVNVNGAYPLLRHVSISTGGIDSSPEVHGVFNDGSNPALRHCDIEVSEGISCRGITNAGNSSPEITDSKIAASAGAGVAHGIFNADSSLSLRNTAIESGGSSSYGVDIRFPSGPSAQDIGIHSSHILLGGGGQYGIYNDLANLSGELTMGIYSSTITGPVGMWGIYNTGSNGPQEIKIHASQIFGGGGGSGGCIETNTNVTVRAGASMLHGTVGGGGTEICGQCYDGAFADLNAACQ